MTLIVTSAGLNVCVSIKNSVLLFASYGTLTLFSCRRFGG
jgi:hypothetical protein